jgi:hypothetical protein
MKSNFSVWQVTLPLAGVVMFATAALTAIYMSNGGLVFQLDATPGNIKVNTEIQKNNNNKEQLNNVPTTQEKNNSQNQHLIPRVSNRTTNQR